MRKALPFLGLLFISFVADGTKDAIGVPGPIEYNGTKFELAKTNHPRDNYYEQFYIPAGEKLDSFQQMMSVFLYDSAYTPEDAAIVREAELRERKKTDLMCNFQKTVNKQKGEFMVDATTGEAKGEALLSYRFTIYRYKQISLGKKRPGLVVYGYAAQRYLDSIPPFLKTLREERIRRLNELGNTDIPAITLPEK